MKTTAREVKKRFSPESYRRKRVLKAAGHTYDDLAARAGVTWRMAKFWMDDEKTSAGLQKAFDELTADVDEDRAANESVA